MKKTLGIVGITGAVGQTLLEIIEREDDILFDEIKLFASKSSVGKVILVNKKKLAIEETSLEFLMQCQAVIFATDASIAAEFIPKLAACGIFCVDKSSAFRADERVPLVVPEVNGQLISPSAAFPVVASPNCCTIPLVMVLKALDDKFGVQKAIVSTYQSVSGAGRPGVELLTQETQQFFVSHDLSCKKSNLFPKSIAFNVMPFVSGFLDSGDTDEESKIKLETKKVLNKPNFAIGATSVRVPTFVGHAESVTLELQNPFLITDVIKALAQFPGIIVVDEQNRQNEFVQNSDDVCTDFVTPREAHGQDAVFVSRIRRCEAFKNGLSLWIVCDNLRKGAALNAWQIVNRFFATSIS